MCSGAKIIRKGAKDWSAVDWALLEESWGETDEDAEKISESDVLMNDIKRRKLEVGKSDKSKMKRMTKREKMDYIKNIDSINREEAGKDVTFCHRGVINAVIIITLLIVEVMKYSLNLFFSGSMLFVNLHTASRTSPGAPELTEDDISRLSGEWKSLLQTAGYSASIYNIKDGKLLVSTPRSWHMTEIKKFFITRDEVKSVELNGEITEAKDYVEEF